MLENRTFFDGISVLPGAAQWVLRGGAAERKATYFQPRDGRANPARAGSLLPGVPRRLLRNLPRYFEGREQIGISLTGGLDTRMIMASCTRPPESLPCYTFAGMFRDSQDVLVAREVASVCGEPHQVIRVGEEFLARFPRYAERTVYLTDGCAEVSRAPDLYLNESARQIAPVRMTGNYGGEVLRRVRASSPPSRCRVCSLRISLLYFARPKEHMPSSFADTRCHSPCFSRLPGITTGRLRWNRPSSRCGRPTSTMIWFEPSSAPRSRPAPTANSACASSPMRIPALRQIRTDRGLGGRGVSALALRALREFQFKAEYAYDYGMPQWMVRNRSPACRSPT